MFIPFLVYLASSITMMYLSLTNESMTSDNKYPISFQYAMIVITLISWAYMVYLELVELFKRSSGDWWDAIFNLWNLNDYTHLILVLMLSIANLFVDPPSISI